MNYIDEVAASIGRRIDMSLDDPVEAELLRMYAVLVFVKRADTTREDVHDAWAAWTAKHRPGHPALVPFAALPAAVQAKDQEYVDALRAECEERGLS